MQTPEQLRAQAAWFRQFPGPKAQRAARLAELAAKAQERRMTAIMRARRVLS